MTAEKMRTVARKPVLLHMTTVPMTLRFLSGQVGFMKERGIDVHVLSSPGEDLDEFSGREAVPAHSLAMSRAISPIEDAVSLWGICKLLGRIRPDIVHTHTPKASLLGLLAAWMTRVPARIYHVHGLPLVTASGLKRRILRITERVSCALATKIFCVSPSVRGVMVEEGLVSGKQVRVLRGGSINGVDAAGVFDPSRYPPQARQEVRDRFGIPHDAVVLGYVGRIVRDKGWQELAAAWRRLRNAYPQLHLLVVGPFEVEDAVSEDVRRLLHEDPHIRLVGVDWNTAPLYRAMDLLVLPTYREGFPVVPLEAAAMELPVVATRVPGCVDAVRDEETGILVPPRDPEALESALRRYLDEPALRRRHGQAARARVLRDFRQEVIWKAVHDEYVAALGLPCEGAATAPAAAAST
jgi:glycosyltransferase involved in cell wall biosynthesis